MSDDPWRSAINAARRGRRWPLAELIQTEAGIIPPEHIDAVVHLLLTPIERDAAAKAHYRAQRAKGISSAIAIRDMQRKYGLDEERAYRIARGHNPVVNRKANQLGSCQLFGGDEKNEAA